MSNTTKSSAGGGIGFFGLLTIAFIVLKLCNVIHWSWWWVFAPLWGPFAAVLAFVAITIIIALVHFFVKALVAYHKSK